jgi:5-hydroxyisourate hydrolase
VDFAAGQITVGAAEQASAVPRPEKAAGIRTDMAGLSTHILDTHGGKPGNGVSVTLKRLHPDGARETLRERQTNEDGRATLLAAEDTVPGIYEIDFAIGPYFRAKGIDLPDPAFLDLVTVRFGISDVARHYHVPLLTSPYGYTTYRGS